MKDAVQLLKETLFFGDKSREKNLAFNLMQLILIYFVHHFLKLVFF